MKKIYSSLGLMSGTSLDGIDTSLIASDGEKNIEIIDNKFVNYSSEFRNKLTNYIKKVHSKEDIINAKNGNGPSLIECVTYRYRGHYEGDPQPYRTKDEVDKWKKRDPIKITEKILLDNKVLNNEIIDSINLEINTEIEDAVNFAKNSLEPELEESLKDIYTDIIERDNSL